MSLGSRHPAAFKQRFNLRYPIVQAPMGGGATTVELVSQVCEAGALGFIAAAYLSPGRIQEFAGNPLPD